MRQKKKRKWTSPVSKGVTCSQTQDTPGMSCQCSATELQQPDNRHAALTILSVYCTDGTECLSCLHTWQLLSMCIRTPFRAAERIGGGPRANTQSGAPQNELCERGQEILRFYMLLSVFWGLLRLFFVHAHSTQYIYTGPASCRFRLAVSDRKVRRTGP